MHIPVMISNPFRLPPFLLLDAEAVQELLPVSACIGVMKQALTALARKEAANPLRTVIRTAEGAVAAMPAYDGDSAVGAKIVAVVPGNVSTGLPTHLGLVLLLDAHNGVPLAIVDATSITAIRTAAVSGVATDALAREDASICAIIGTGVQAAAHVAAMTAVRPIRSVRIVSRDFARAGRVCAELAAEFACAFEPVESVERAVSGADVVCTITNSATPVLHGEWLAAGVHINAVGASLSHARELDAAAVARSRLYCDSRVSMLSESGDFLFARAEGWIDESHIVGELGDVLLGTAPGRRSPDDITLFKSLGLGIEDIAAARYVHDRAVEQGRGVRVSA
jgi:ornithine cyclodeaminase